MAIIRAETNTKNLLDIYSKHEKRKEFYQYDTKQRLVINIDTLNPDEGKVEFDNAEITEPIAHKIYEHNGKKVCDVPDELLGKAEPFKAYLSVNDEYGCKTIYEKTFNVKARDKPADYISVTPNEAYENGYDKGYSDGYSAGQESVQNPLEYALNTNYSQVAFPDGYELVLDMPNVVSMAYLMPYTTGIKKVTLKGNKDRKALDMTDAFRESSIEVVDMTEFAIIPTNITYVFYEAISLREIKGIIDIRQCTSAKQPFDYCEKLEEFRLLPNSVAYQLGLPHSPLLSAETRQSIVDALTSFGGVLRLHSEVTAKFTPEQILEITSKNWRIQ